MTHLTAIAVGGSTGFAPSFLTFDNSFHFWQHSVLGPFTQTENNIKRRWWRGEGERKKVYKVLISPEN